MSEVICKCLGHPTLELTVKIPNIGFHHAIDSYCGFMPQAINQFKECKGYNDAEFNAQKLVLKRYRIKLINFTNFCIKSI